MAEPTVVPEIALLEASEEPYHADSSTISLIYRSSLQHGSPSLSCNSNGTTDFCSAISRRHSSTVQAGAAPARLATRAPNALAKDAMLVTGHWSP